MLELHCGNLMHVRPLILNNYRYRSTYLFRTPQVIPIYHHSCNCIIFPPRHGLFIGLTPSYIQMGDRNNPKRDDILKNTPVTDSPMPGPQSCLQILAPPWFVIHLLPLAVSSSIILCSIYMDASWWQLVNTVFIFIIILLFKPRLCN